MDNLIKLFDDITIDDNGHKWSQISKCHTKELNISESILDEAGQGICGVIGCDNEADYYIDFNE